MDPPSRVLVPLDESPQSFDALEYALVQFPSATVVVVTVIDPIEVGYSAEAIIPSGEWFDDAKAEARDRFDRAEAMAAERGIDVETRLEVGRPSRVIVDLAERDADHVVMGSHGRSGVARVLLGSVAETVVRRSPVPVTVVR